MAGTKNSKEQGQDWPLLTPKQRNQFGAMASLEATDPGDRDMALISKALMLCPLPYRKTADVQVVRETRIPGGTITAILTRLDDKILLPYGDDAFVLDLLSSEARRRKSPEISTENLADLMRLLGMEHLSGEDYRRFTARIQRISAFGLRVKRRGVPTANARVVDIDGSDIWSKQDLKLEKQGVRRMIPRIIRLSPEYFTDLMSQYAAMPIDVLDTFSGNPTAYALAKWLWWRADVAESEGTVSWEELAQERGSQDSNVQRFKVKVRGVLATLATGRPDVAKLFRATPQGLRITPIDALPKAVENSLF